ncbi:MAG: response regulator [Cyanobacteria bacterium REEB67]|nr:response regulator [Cyanobacteria bacterium REEB67]
MNKKDALIFLVEDEPTLQYVFRRQLDRLGYKVAGVSGDGRSAVENVLQNQYHVVFMDVRLPGMDGLTATRRIREVEAQKGVRTSILGLTAFADQKPCLDAGMDDFLQKPVLLEEMDAILTKWLDLPQVESVPLEKISLGHFVETGDRLKNIQQKLAALRKQAGLSKEG